MSSRVLLVGGVALLGFFAGITGIRLAYTLTYVLVLLLLISWLWTRAVARRLEMRRESPPGPFSVGESFVESFTVHNRSALWAPWCEIHDRSSLHGYHPGRACALGAGDSVSWTVRGCFWVRGEHRLGPLEAVVGDPFGLFSRTAVLAAERSVLVHPALHAIEDVLPQWSGTAGDDARHAVALDLPPEVSTVREYDPGDGMNRIHWRSTAHAGRLMSRTFDSRHSSDLLVVLDLRQSIHVGRPPESTLEYAVSLAASVVSAASRRGQAVGLITNDALLTAFGAGRGESHRVRLLDYLATCDAGGTVPLADLLRRHGDGWRGRGSIVVVTADREPSWVEALVDSGSRGQRHLAVMVEPVSFGAAGHAVRIPAAWRLALDWWLVRRGDCLDGARVRAAHG